jgi:hypothetical protein
MNLFFMTVVKSDSRSDSEPEQKVPLKSKQQQQQQVQKSKGTAAVTATPAKGKADPTIDLLGLFENTSISDSAVVLLQPKECENSKYLSLKSISYPLIFINLFCCACC